MGPSGRCDNTMAALNHRDRIGVFHLTAMINLYSLRGMASVGAAACLAVVLGLPTNIDAKQAPAQGTCRVTGHATSAQQPLPGVAISIKSGTTLKAATSTDQDGSYGITLTPGQYTVTADLTGFGRVEQTITIVADGSCPQTFNIPMTLAPRQPLPQAAPASTTTPAIAPAAGGRGTQRTGGGRGAPPAGRSAQSGNQRVQVQVQAQGDAAQVAANETTTEDAARLLLPPGFSSEGS